MHIFQCVYNIYAKFLRTTERQLGEVDYAQSIYPATDGGTGLIRANQHTPSPLESIIFYDSICYVYVIPPKIYVCQARWLPWLGRDGVARPSSLLTPSLKSPRSSFLHHTFLGWDDEAPVNYGYALR